MASMSRREVAERAALDLRDAVDALSQVRATGGLKQFESAREFAQAGLARIASVTETPVAGSARKIPTEPRLSSSLVTGLQILALFPVDGDARFGIAEVADVIGRSRSTAHRYLTTLVAAGQLEQDARRKYCRPRIDGATRGDVASLQAHRARPRATSARSGRAAA